MLVLHFPLDPFPRILTTASAPLSPPLGHVPSLISYVGTQTLHDSILFQLWWQEWTQPLSPLQSAWSSGRSENIHAGNNQGRGCQETLLLGRLCRKQTGGESPRWRQRRHLHTLALRPVDTNPALLLSTDVLRSDAKFRGGLSSACLTESAKLQNL